ncbi:hypothetical protein GCM10010324_45720 [Streptomyces hiroshimensis]|uniref:Uncharacterized protein n=1 Tax=Streptomyces hiroshimensis TaxID=66424 RepID=A0ABQ2YWE7_9ACTN|nr:hypothetical protein GCM10010324_45720 [Streptomyces hiroshimensis]
MRAWRRGLLGRSGRGSAHVRERVCGGQGGAEGEGGGGRRWGMKEGAGIIQSAYSIGEMTIVTK